VETTVIICIDIQKISDCITTACPLCAEIGVGYTRVGCEAEKSNVGPRIRYIPYGIWDARLAGPVIELSIQYNISCSKDGGDRPEQHKEHQQDDPDVNNLKRNSVEISLFHENPFSSIVL
jgi:hypothetical protein